MLPMEPASQKTMARLPISRGVYQEPSMEWIPGQKPDLVAALEV